MYVDMYTYTRHIVNNAHVQYCYILISIELWGCRFGFDPQSGHDKADFSLACSVNEVFSVH